MKHQSLFFLLLMGMLGTSACNAPEQEAVTTEAVAVATPDPNQVEQVLDDWHQAAAEADFNRYFNHFRNDSSVFIGTDATERWTVAEFKPWAKPYFDRGSAWNFTPHNRHVYFSADGHTAWFDEELETPNLGPSRGTGVLLHTPEGWKIEHYNLAVPIPNEVVDKVVVLVDSTLQAKATTGATD